MASTLAKRTAFHATNRLANYFIGPGAVTTSRFVSPVKVDHHLIFRGLFDKLLIMVYNFLSFVVEEIYLGTGYTQTV